MAGGETPIVIVTGPPASGKSTLAAAVAEGAWLPLLAKDALKEILCSSSAADARTCSSRDLARAETRHRGHLDANRVGEVREALRGDHALGVPGE